MWGYVAEKLSISQLNKIGERLRKNLESEEDLRLLDVFRSSFTPAYQEVFDHLSQLGLKPGGREGKTTLSIRAKLVRERTRLSRMQDIAGCRVEVDNLIEQDRVVDEMKVRWPCALIHDRRVKPSSGYRAVHLVVEVDGLLVEIQIRTSLQHSWASATEKLSDVCDPEIKYGGGPEEIQKSLTEFSNVFAIIENVERNYAEVRAVIANSVMKGKKEVDVLDENTEKLQADLKATHEGLNAALKKFCERFTIADREGSQ